MLCNISTGQQLMPVWHVTWLAGVTPWVGMVGLAQKCLESGMRV
jgi:hypothetical protein